MVHHHRLLGQIDYLGKSTKLRVDCLILWSLNLWQVWFLESGLQSVSSPYMHFRAYKVGSTHTDEICTRMEREHRTCAHFSCAISDSQRLRYQANSTLLVCVCEKYKYKPTRPISAQRTNSIKPHNSSLHTRKIRYYYSLCLQQSTSHSVADKHFILWSC